MVACTAGGWLDVALMRRILSTPAGDDEGVVRLWDSRQSEAVATLEAHSGGGCGERGLVVGCSALSSSCWTCGSRSCHP